MAEDWASWEVEWEGRSMERSLSRRRRGYRERGTEADLPEADASGTVAAMFEGCALEAVVRWMKVVAA